MHVRSLAFATDLAVLRAGGSTITVEDDDLLVVRTHSNPGYWWGNFALVAAPEALGRGIEAFGRELPEARHLTIGVDGTDGAVPPAHTEWGLAADIGAVLTASEVAPPAPVDAEVRTLSEGRDWEQLFELRQEDDPATDDPETDALYQRRQVETVRRLIASGAGVFFGAFRDGRMVSTLGVVWDGSGTARYQHVQTRAGHRRQGLASHLVAAAARTAARCWDVDRFVIVADPEGPAINLYRALGFSQAELQVQLARTPQPSVSA